MTPSDLAPAALEIRTAINGDAIAIAELLAVLGYPGSRRKHSGSPATSHRPAKWRGARCRVERGSGGVGDGAAGAVHSRRRCRGADYHPRCGGKLRRGREWDESS